MNKQETGITISSGGMFDYKIEIKHRSVFPILNLVLKNIFIHFIGAMYQRIMKMTNYCHWNFPLQTTFFPFRKLLIVFWKTVLK